MAQETLGQVVDIETAINSSEYVRQQVVDLQQETDEMIADINNITETVRNIRQLPYTESAPCRFCSPKGWDGVFSLMDRRDRIETASLPSSLVFRFSLGNSGGKNVHS